MEEKEEIEEMKKILVAEDNELNLRLLVTTLEKAGYKVISTADGLEAVELARKERPDMILLDINIPGMKGFDAKEALKNYPETRDIPVCFITGLLDKEEEAKLDHRLLGNYFFAKPFNSQELLNMIEKRI